MTLARTAGEGDAPEHPAHRCQEAMTGPVGAHYYHRCACGAMWNNEAVQRAEHWEGAGPCVCTPCLATGIAARRAAARAFGADRRRHVRAIQGMQADLSARQREAGRWRTIRQHAGIPTPVPCQTVTDAPAMTRSQDTDEELEAGARRAHHRWARERHAAVREVMARLWSGT